MRSVAPACLGACFAVHMCACKLYDHALRGNVDTAPRRTGVDEPRRQCDQVHRTSCAPASLKYAVSERLSARAHARCAHVRRSAVTHVRLTSRILRHALGIQEANQRKGGADLAWTSRQLRAGAPVHRITREKDKWPAMAHIALSGPCEEGRGACYPPRKARRIVTAGAHVHLRTSPTPSAVTSAWTWAYGDCAKGGLGSESFPCSSTDSAQVTFPTPWLRLPVATQSLGLPHDAGADFLLSVSCLTSPRRPRPTLTSLTNCRCLSLKSVGCSRPRS